MEIVKDTRKDFAKDEHGNFDLNSVFLVQVINHSGEVAYTGTQDGKNITVNQICHLCTKFGDYKSAKAFANTIKGARTNVIGKHKIEKIILEQENNATIPIDKVEGEMYHVVVNVKETGDLLGYITYKSETDEYSVIKSTDNAAFWNSTESADAFITEATKTFLAQHQDLTLEKVKYK